VDEKTQRVLIEPLLERRNKNKGQATLDRLWLGRREETSVASDGQERLYIFLDARGALSVLSLGAHWQYRLRSNAVAFLPARVGHRITNSGDAPLRAIVFTVHVAALELGGELHEGPILSNLNDIVKRDMVSFITQTLLVAREAGARTLALSEHQTVLPGGSVPKHVHEAREELCYLSSGRGTLLLGDSEHVLEAGEAVRIPPGTPHSMLNKGDAVLEYIIAQSLLTRRGRAPEVEQAEGSHEAAQPAGSLG